jgi:hypothetical protein
MQRMSNMTFASLSSLFDSTTTRRLVCGRFVCTQALLAVALVAAAACASSPDGHEPDAMTEPAPLDPVGVFELRSSYSLAAPPAIAAPMLAELAAATDGPDDPARFMIDRLVARLPDGRTQLVAAAVAPYIAAYVQARIDTFAPKLAAGIRGLEDGLGQIARRFGTAEQLTIGRDGRARRLITGLRFEPRSNATDASAVEVSLAPLGIADIATASSFALAADRLTLGEHSADLPYGAILRAGLDRAVIPRVVPGTASLEDALVALVDCGHLGMLMAEYVGIGTPDLYARACTMAITHLAAEIYERIGTARVVMTVAGAARVIDLDGDGPVDVIASGTWSGTIGGAPLALSVFEGATP